MPAVAVLADRLYVARPRNGYDVLRPDHRERNAAVRELDYCELLQAPRRKRASDQPNLDQQRCERVLPVSSPWLGSPAANGRRHVGQSLER